MHAFRGRLLLHRLQRESETLSSSWEMQRRGLLPFSSEGSTAFFVAWGARENTGTIRREGIMQMQIFRKAVLGLMVLGLTVGMLAILSCGGSSDDNTVKRQANFTGAAERTATNAPNPATVNTPGSGTAALTISEDQSQITYTLTYTGLSNVH